eukprot:TRINITY_DN9320_c0_g1_i1.p1 TRINITY_DN9320_c0_g1~~TRINITY_DN9320_c0_g1_i1.p1  ORF type:complete len:295 (+),score=89.81 TRINITY_DN9320_c0_g1_i1:90-887(+)
MSGPPGAAEVDVEQFIAENEFDEEVAEVLRAQPPDVARVVMAHGSFREVRNPMAVLRTRIRDASSSGELEWNVNGGGARRGRVKLWQAAKGYGFIIDSETGDEIFCHHGDIGGRSLIKGGEVTFDLTQFDGTKIKATNVTGAVGPRIDTRPFAGGQALIGPPPPQGKGMKGMKGKPGAKGAGGGGYAPYQGAPAGGAANGKGPPAKGQGAGKGPPKIQWAEAEVHVTLPQGYVRGCPIRFNMTGSTYEIQPPPGVLPGQSFVVDL